MTILINRVWFPPNQSSKIAKAYVDFLKDNPPDSSIEKTIAIAVGSDESGRVLVYGLGQVMKGKEKEALARSTQQNLYLSTKMDDLKYKTEILLDFNEAYKILGITAPEVV